MKHRAAWDAFTALETDDHIYGSNNGDEDKVVMLEDLKQQDEKVAAGVVPVRPVPIDSGSSYAKRPSDEEIRDFIAHTS